MILANPSKIAIQRQAYADMKEKRAFEDMLAKDIRREFRRIGEDYETVFASTGHQLYLSGYEEAIAKVLRDSYRKVSGAFKDNIRENLSPSLNSRLKGPSVSTEIDLILKNYFDARAKNQAKLIIDTTHDRMTEALAGVIEDSSTGNLSNADQYEIAAGMARWFRDIAPGRATAIGMTEVGNSAEVSKHTESIILKKALQKPKFVAILYGIKVRVVFPIGSPEANKVWVTTLDEKTRPEHAEADFQSVAWGEAFNVGGEQMQYPTDESMGASIGNVINCRCDSVYYMRGEVTMGEEPEL